MEAEDFRLEYTDARGEVRGGPLEVMWPTRFEATRQVRAFPSYRGQRNLSGWYWAATCAELVGYESWVELGHLMRLDAEPDMVLVAEGINEQMDEQERQLMRIASAAPGTPEWWPPLIMRRLLRHTPSHAR